ncbi:MAG: RNA 2',3'-cyclic phosphodiesterase [Bacteroidota bacterium]
MGMLRLFIAVETPADVREALGQLRDRLAASGAQVRWEPNDKLHCTLLFLGETEESALPTIREAVMKPCAGCAPIAVAYRGIGYFPDSRRPRVVWAGMEDPQGALGRLQQEIASKLATAGYPGDEKPFHPHITLGRVKSLHGINRLITIAESCTFDHPSVTVREIAIIRSELKSGGSVYTILHSIPLSA